MNPQPSEFFSGLIAFVIVCSVLLYMLQMDWKPSISDRYTIGYIQREQQPVTVVVNNQPKKPDIDRKMYLQCVDAMISLGHKRTVAARKTKEIFNDHNPKSVQEFINIAFRKED